MAKKSVREKSVHGYGGKPTAPEEVPASRFKNTCLELIERVRQTREEIVVTRYGRPVAKLVAYEEGPATVFGHLAGSVTIHGDVVAPVGDEWDAER